MVFFDIASSWHRIYALYVEALLRYGSGLADADATVGDDSACYLGRWLAANESRYSALPDYLTLREVHAVFHRQADKATREATRSGADHDEMIESLRTASQAVVAAIAAFSVATGAKQGSGRGQPAAPKDCPIHAYQLGVEVIDEQHAALARLTGFLAGDPGAKLCASGNPEVLAELASLAELHFKTEEIYMRHIAMPRGELAAHVAAHRSILDTLHKLGANAAEMEQLTVGDILPKFSRWFAGHLIDFDYAMKVAQADAVPGAGADTQITGRRAAGPLMQD
jgi:hemerythrin-like metal-binding protein